MHHDDKARKSNERERPNRESNMEPAEGSRENTNVSEETAGNQGGRGTSTMHNAERGQGEQGGELPAAAFGEGEHGGGISNRPLEEEQGRQENLPPRGERREDWKED